MVLTSSSSTSGSSPSEPPEQVRPHETRFRGLPGRLQARGYRDPEYFKLKILQRCGLPLNPWARIVL